MSDEDIPWDELKGGYRVPYDPRPALAAVEAGTGSWKELWEELHHQNDVGEASYAAIPIIARIADSASSASWDPFALAAVIELCRRHDWNPDLPSWLAEDYSAAWDRLFRAAHRLLPDAQDDATIEALIAVIAIRMELPWLGKMAIDFDEGERRALFHRLIEVGVSQD
jgi:hypothetical protein